MSSNTMQGFLNFPKQKIVDSKKTEDFYKDCIDFAENLLSTDYELRQSFQNKNENYNLRSNIIDRKNVERTLNPDKLDMDTLPATFQHIGLGNNKLNLLIGEYIKRKKEWRAFLSASDKEGLSRKEKTLTKELKAKTAALIQKTNITPQEMEQELNALQKWATYDFQDIAEITANKILKREIKDQDIEFLFTRKFEDLLIAGEMIGYAGIFGGLPGMLRIDPRNFFTIGGHSMYIHESDIMVHYGYQSTGQVLDDFYDKLSEKDVEYLESGYGATSSTSLGLNRDISLMERYGPDKVEIFNPSTTGARNYAGAYDTQGNIRVIRACWRGKRKIGKRKYYDDFGQEQYDYVPDTYKEDKDAGEEIKWMWVNEWQQATKIGENIYVDMGPVPYASKSIVNKSKGTPPFFGVINATNNNKVQSLTDIIKPLDYSYDIAYFKREIEQATHVGSIAAINAAMIPSGMNPRDWMHYAKVNKFAWLDPTNEILKGPSQGKSAGAFNTLTATSVNISNADSIRMYTDLMFDIEDKIGKLSGVHGGREGQIQSSEAVNNVEREVTQTSHITEKWFALERQYRKLGLTKFLECCKYAYKKNPKRGQYILDDMSMAMVSHFDEFVNSEMDIHIANSSNDTRLFDRLEQLSQAAIQNGNATIADLISIMQSESIQDTARKLQDSAKRLSEEQKQLQQAALESNEKIKAQDAELKAAQQAFEKYKADLEAQVKREKIASDERIAMVKGDNVMGGKLIDSDRNGIADELDLERTKIQAKKNDEDIALKEKQLQETIRHNKETEKISKQKKASSGK